MLDFAFVLGSITTIIFIGVIFVMITSKRTKRKIILKTKIFTLVVEKEEWMKGAPLGSFFLYNLESICQLR